MNEVINNNKYKLKYCFAMLYIHGRKFMIDSVFLIKGLVKTLFYVTLSKFGRQFSCAQKRLPISKTPCITPCKHIVSEALSSYAYNLLAIKPSLIRIIFGAILQTSLIELFYLLLYFSYYITVYVSIFSHVDL